MLTTLFATAGWAAIAETVGIWAAGLGTAWLLTAQSFFYAEPGNSYLVQYPWGPQHVEFLPGYHARWFGESIGFNKTIAVTFIDDDDLWRRNQAGASFAGVSPPYEIRFNDSVTAEVKMTARFELPTDPERFLAMAVAYRTQENLVFSTLLPVMKEAMWNAGRMFSAQAYIGGSGGDFENAIADQIQNGIYLLDVSEERVFAGPAPITEPDGRQIQQDETTRVRVSIRMRDGVPLRKDAENHPLQKFGIRLVQANVHGVDPDPVFKEKLREQREAAAQVAIERQLTRQEEERKKRILAQGEAEKAEKRVELEVQQIEQVLRAETRAKEAEQEQIRRVTEANTRRQEAEIELERRQVELHTAELEAQRIQTLAEAEANRRRQLMEADNALQQRLDAYQAVAQAFAAAIRGQRMVPEVVVGGSGGAAGGSANATDLINLMMARFAADLGVVVTAPANGNRTPAAR